MATMTAPPPTNPAHDFVRVLPILRSLLLSQAQSPSAYQTFLRPGLATVNRLHECLRMCEAVCQHHTVASLPRTRWGADQLAHQGRPTDVSFPNRLTTFAEPREPIVTA